MFTETWKHQLLRSVRSLLNFFFCYKKYGYFQGNNFKIIAISIIWGRGMENRCSSSKLNASFYQMSFTIVAKSRL